MQILKWQKKEERLGRERKKGRPRRFYRTLNYRFRETEILIGRLLVNLSKTKTAQSQGVQFSRRLFTAHGEQTRSVNCTPLFQMVFKGANCLRWNHDYILGQNMSFFRTIGFLVREDERTISVSLPGL